MHDVDRIPAPGAPPRRPWERRPRNKRQAATQRDDREAPGGPAARREEAGTAVEPAPSLDIRI